MVLEHNLPMWFTVSKPVGTSNPEWALVWEDTDEYGGGGEKQYLLRETNGSTELADLDLSEQQKVRHAASRRNSAWTFGVS